MSSPKALPASGYNPSTAATVTVGTMSRPMIRAKAAVTRAFWPHVRSKKGVQSALQRFTQELKYSRYL